MRSSRQTKAMIGSLCVLISVIMIGCGTLQAVKVSLTGYNPAFSKDYGAYKGKPVYLMNFDNQANDTSIWYYYSPDKKFSYAGDGAIHNYFWFAFQRGFTKLGIVVSSMDHPDYMAPAMWVTLLSITDASYQVRVTVQKKGATEFTDTYTIQEPPLPEKDRTPAALEQRAYRMTNRLVETVIADPRFRKVITEP